jgi:hypothetical protein
LAQTKTLILLFVFLSSVYAQAGAAGKVSIAGAARMSAVQPAPFNVLTLTTQNPFAPSTSLLSGFPTVTGGNPAEGYQGGIYINNTAIFTPYQYDVAIPHGTVLAYTGGPSGTFHCTGPASCAANWSFFDMTNTGNLPLNCPSGYGACPAADSASGYTCQVILDNNSIMYYIPGADQQFPVMMAYNALGSGGITNPANYAYFSAPSKSSGSPLGAGYGWCTGVFDGRYVYYAPTAGGTYANSTFLRYDTQAGAFPRGFVISNFSHYDLANGPGGTTAGVANSCCFLSSAYDGQQKIYLLPHQGGWLTVYDTMANGGFTASSSYKVLNMANLGTSGYPQVTGNGNLKAIQTLATYVGGQMIWNTAGTTEFLYMAPFGGNPAATSYAGTILLSDVIRVPVATCSPGVPGSQTCSGTFTALDITASTSTWEIFDLANLVTNRAWAAAGFPYPPLYTPPSPLTNQLTLGGFQLTWLNVHNLADPIVGFVADYGNFYVRHHASHTLSDPSGWDVVERPAGQANGCMGGGYDPVNQLLYVSCPAATPVPSAWQIGPL